MKGQMAQQLAVLNEILKQNSSREQKILDETPLAVLANAAQQQQMMAPEEEVEVEEEIENEQEDMGEEQEMNNDMNEMMS